MGPITPVQPVPMPLNKEVKEQSNWSQSDFDLSDSTRATAHVTSSIDGFTPKDDSDLENWIKYH